MTWPPALATRMKRSTDHPPDQWNFHNDLANSRQTGTLNLWLDLGWPGVLGYDAI